MGHWFHLHQEQSKRLLRQKGFILLRLLAFFGSSPEKTNSEVGRAGIGRIQGFYDITHICQYVMNINTRKMFIYCNMIEYVHTHVYTRNVGFSIFLWSRTCFFSNKIRCYISSSSQPGRLPVAFPYLPRWTPSAFVFSTSAPGVLRAAGCREINHRLLVKIGQF